MLLVAARWHLRSCPSNRPTLITVGVPSSWISTINNMSLTNLPFLSYQMGIGISQYLTIQKMTLEFCRADTYIRKNSPVLEAPNFQTNSGGFHLSQCCRFFRGTCVSTFVLSAISVSCYQCVRSCRYHGIRNKWVMRSSGATEKILNIRHGHIYMICQIFGWIYKIRLTTWRNTKLAIESVACRTNQPSKHG